MFVCVLSFVGVCGRVCMQSGVRSCVCVWLQVCGLCVCSHVWLIGYGIGRLCGWLCESVFALLQMGMAEWRCE